MSTRLELYERIKRFRDAGFVYREIGDIMGLSRSYVAEIYVDPDGSGLKKRHQRQMMLDGGECDLCSKPTKGDPRTGRPTRCRSCIIAQGSANQIWTRERVIDAMQDYAKQYGTQPSARDWNPTQARNDYRDDLAERFYEDGCWPNVSTVQDLFGSWNSAIIEAGFTPLKAGHKHVDKVRRAA